MWDKRTQGVATSARGMKGTSSTLEKLVVIVCCKPTDMHVFLTVMKEYECTCSANRKACCMNQRCLTSFLFVIQVIPT